MEKNNKIEVTMEDGSKKTGEVVFTFEAQGDNFILYSIEQEVFAAKINENGDLSRVEKDEWKIVEKVFNEYMETNNENF